MKSVILLAFFSLFSTVPASAQQRAWFLDARGDWNERSSPTAGRLTELAVDENGTRWSVLRTVDIPLHAITADRAVYVRGGRYIAWFARTLQPGPAASGLAYFDTHTNRVHLVPGLQVGSTAKLDIDRRSGRVVILDSHFMYFIDIGDSTTIRTVVLPNRPYDSFAVGRGRVFISRVSFFGPSTMVLDADTGASLGELPGGGDVQVSADERRLYLQVMLGGETVAVSTYDTDTLLATSYAWLGPSEVPLTVFDNFLIARRWIHWHARMEVRGFDALHLTPLFNWTYTWYPYHSRAVDFFRPSRRSPYFVRSRGIVNYFGCESVVDVFDPTDLSVTFEFSPRTLGLPRCGVPMLMLAPPDAPTNMAAIVSGRSVTLSWDPPRDVADYEVEVGSQPLLRDLAIVRTGGRASFRVENAPSGTYYVRVRAINELGTSAASVGVQVTVP